MEKDNQTCCNLVERKPVGRVSQQERDVALALFERKNGLTELVYSLAESNDEMLKNEYFYDKIVMDMGKTTTKLEQWWEEKAKAYQWEAVKGFSWEIDFDTCQVFLRKNE